MKECVKKNIENIKWTPTITTLSQADNLIKGICLSKDVTQEQADKLFNESNKEGAVYENK